MDPTERIRTFLAAARAQLLASWAARAGLWALAAAIAALVLVPLAAAWLSLGRGLGVATLVVAVPAAALALWHGVLSPRRRWRGDAAVARFVGTAVAERQPRLRSDLLSAVELTSPSSARRRSAPSPALVDALLDQTAAQLGGLDARGLIDRRPVHHAAIALATSVVVAGGLLLTADRLLARGWQRLLHPAPEPYAGATLSPVPLVGDMRITLEYPAYAHRSPLVLPTASGDFQALPGTRVLIQTTALAPVTTAELLFEDELPAPGAAIAPTRAPPEPPPATAPVEVAGTDLSVRFVVQRAARFRFRLEGPAGRRVEAVARHIELEADLAPRVQLFAPADELDVSALKRIELAYAIEDDYGLGAIALVWEQGGKPQRKVLPRDDSDGARDGAIALAPPRTAQAKLLWDLAEIALPPGERVPYHLEVEDNDDVGGPNVGRSRTFFLRVFSPREKNEQNIERLRELAERGLRNLGGRLTTPPGELGPLEAIHRDTAAMVVEAGTLVAALADDVLASRHLRDTLDALRDRLERLVAAEAKLLAPPTPPTAKRASPPRPAATAVTPRLAAANRTLIAELEDDAILLADWIEREHLETLLAIGDEIKDHRQRLEKLLEEYQRTGAAELKDEIDRELRALQARLAELAAKRGRLAEDVLDAFVNSDAMQEQRAESCFDEVKRLLDAGDLDGGKRKLASCNGGLDSAAAAMEQALAGLRGDKFSDEQQKYQALMDELAEITQDQKDIAAGLDQVWDRYAQRADELMVETAKETRKKLATTLDKLRERLKSVPTAGLTPFSQEEMEIVDRRLDDLDAMLADGDLAEALAMAKQAADSIDTIEAELEAALADEQDAPWNGPSNLGEDALHAMRKAKPLARKLVEELEAASPAPGDILSDDDRKELERLQRRQQSNDQRARKLGERAGQSAADLPGNAGAELGERLDDARGHMGRAAARAKAQDPSSARQEAGAAADALAKAQAAAQGAARQQQQSSSGLRDEAIRIPGADEYKAPAQFREDIIEAMKKGQAPDGFADQVRRYYEELIR